jgi:hypothetical protein
LGLVVVQPNTSVVLTFFGKYVGTVKDNGLFFVNPLYTKQKVSLRLQSLESTKLKVNDKLGNPIEIAAVILWQIEDTYKVCFDVVNFSNYMTNQSEAALRHMASTCPYDTFEGEQVEVTLRDGGEKVIEMLEHELNARMIKAGIVIKEARISHLAYAPEIAHAMLQRQQATAIVAARSKIVEGAVGMVEMALEMLSKKQIVELDEERKAAMVSNLLGCTLWRQGSFTCGEYRNTSSIIKWIVLSKKSFVLRIDQTTYAALEKWAADEFRSVNGQIEMLIDQSLRNAGRKKEAIAIKPKPKKNT